MKPVASTITEIDNLEGKETKFGIGKGQEAWVMRSMADLYSNRELACVREYSTNAYDSNKEKALRDGHDIEPIKVTLPSAMNPYFTVSDSGVGMSYTELNEVYTQFGDSTKRDSNEFNGMLGFGSKSAIAYTNTFTITSVKDGLKNVGVVTRREDAMGGYVVTLKTVMEDIPTADTNGVSIQIPVHNWREFEQKANDFYRFWLPGTVIVNGREPEWAVGDRIDNGLFYYPNGNGQNMSYVVMGNVPYRIVNSDALFPRGMNRISFVAYVDLGTVEFTPSREDLKYSEHTKKNLRKIITDFVDKSVATAKKEIAEAKTHSEAYLVWSKWRKVIGVGQVDDLSFKGDKLVDDFAIEGSRFDTSAYRYSVWSIKSWQVQHMSETIIITDFDINLAAAHRKKVKEWMGATNRSAQFVIFTADKSVTNPWVDQSKVVTWEKVKAEAPKPVKKPKANVAWGRKAGSFDLVSATGRKEEQDVPAAKDLYFVMVQEYNVSKNLAQVLKQFGRTDEVVLVPANRKDKFLRHYPKAKNILDELRASVILDGPSLISKEGKTFLSTTHNERYVLQKLEVSDIDDPDIQNIIPIFKKTEEDYLVDYNKNLTLARSLGIDHKFKNHGWEYRWNSKSQPLSSRYPLAANYNYHDRKTTKHNQHILLYINAVYAARKAGKNV